MLKYVLANVSRPEIPGDSKPWKDGVMTAKTTNHSEAPVSAVRQALEYEEKLS